MGYAKSLGKPVFDEGFPACIAPNTFIGVASRGTEAEIFAFNQK